MEQNKAKKKRTRTDLSGMTQEEKRKHHAAKTLARVTKLRKGEEIRGLEESGRVDAKSFEPVRVTKQWCGNNDCEIIKDQETSPGMSHLFLIKNNKTGTYILTERRITDKKNNEMWAEIRDKKQAEGEFDDWISGHKNQKYFNISDYSANSQRILIKLKNKESIKHMRLPRTFAEVFSIYEEHVFGFPGYEHNRTTDEQHTRVKANKARKIISFLENADLPSGSGTTPKRTQITEMIGGAFEKLIQTGDIEIRSSMNAYVGLVCRSFDFSVKVLAAHSEYFSDLQSIDSDIAKHLNSIIKSNTKTKHKPNNKLGKGSNRPVIQLEDLTPILDAALETGRGIYMQMILDLSTCVRPEEGDRLSRFGKQYLRKDFTLNYRHDGLSKDIPILSQKNLATHPLEDRTNPGVSIISAYILKYESPENPKIFFGTKGYKKHYPDIKFYVRRSLRTTGATMLAYCDKASSSSRRASLRDVQMRMCHKTLTMAMEVYAKTEPMNMPPANYFKINDYGVQFGKEPYMFDGNLWDLWLLRDVIDRMERALSKPEYNQFLMKLVDVAKERARLLSTETEKEYNQIKKTN